MAKIDVVLDLLNANTQEILARISGGELKAEFTSSRVSADKKTLLDKIDILVADSNKQMPINMWSGGQITQVGLAVLLGTFKTAAQISDKRVSMLWLDEPFGPLDDETVDAVFAAIIDTAKELKASSIKIISHKKLDARLRDHLWEIDIEDGISNFTSGS